MEKQAETERPGINNNRKGAEGCSQAVPSGLLLFHKKAALTSFEALGTIKRALGTGKVGHTGTLDKFASGLLLVLTGRALKLSPWFTHCDKQYRGTIRFGKETDTLDIEGAIVAEGPLPSQGAVEQVLPQFTGEVMQAPPVYSAIHINGKRASSLARSGEIPQMKERPVHIYKLRLLSWDPPFAEIFVHCSSGTYIRSLVRDIAIASGSRGHLTALVRTQVAGFKLEDAAESGEWEQEEGGSQQCMRWSLRSKLRDKSRRLLSPLPIDTSIFSALGLPWFKVEAEEAGKIMQGKPLAQIFGDKEPVFPPCLDASAPRCGNYVQLAAGIFCKGNFIAMIEKKDGKWKYGYVYAGALPN
jgi:tRNA pseudouridine55 synthase